MEGPHCLIENGVDVYHIGHTGERVVHDDRSAVSEKVHLHNT